MASNWKHRASVGIISRPGMPFLQNKLIAGSAYCASNVKRARSSSKIIQKPSPKAPKPKVRVQLLAQKTHHTNKQLQKCFWLLLVTRWWMMQSLFHPDPAKYILIWRAKSAEPAVCSEEKMNSAGSKGASDLGSDPTEPNRTGPRTALSAQLYLLGSI